MNKTAILVGLGLLVLLPAAILFGFPGSPAPNPLVPDEPQVSYKRIGMEDYQNFLVNWGNQHDPVLYALVQTPAQYGALFHAAGVMNPKRPYAPPDTLFDKEQILVVGRVIVATESRTKVFEVERLTPNGPTLELHYQFNPPRPDAGTSQEKNFLALRIPKQNFKTVRFFENDQKVGELKLDSGQWSVPAMVVEPN